MKLSTLAGTLCVLAMLLLSSPGVRVVRADAPAAPASGAAPAPSAPR
jgi:hypothetical protein